MPLFLRFSLLLLLPFLISPAPLPISPSSPLSPLSPASPPPVLSCFNSTSPSPEPTPAPPFAPAPPPVPTPLPAPTLLSTAPLTPTPTLSPAKTHAPPHLLHLLHFGRLLLNILNIFLEQVTVS